MSNRYKVKDSFSLVRATAKIKGNITITFKSDKERAIKKGSNNTKNEALRAKTLKEAIISSYINKYLNNLEQICEL